MAEATSLLLLPPALLKCDHGRTLLKVGGSSRAKSGFMKICEGEKPDEARSVTERRHLELEHRTILDLLTRRGEEFV